jgi:hypothetical protein
LCTIIINTTHFLNSIYNQIVIFELLSYYKDNTANYNIKFYIFSNVAQPTIVPINCSGNSLSVKLSGFGTKYGDL